MNDADLPARILAAVAKATSQRPARAPDVLALVGGEEPAFWAAVEQIYRERRINTAHIQKRGDAEPWLAVWPTGLPVTSGAWTADSHSALFVKHRPDDLFLAHAPRSIVKPERAPKAAPTPKPVSTKEPVMDTTTNESRAKGTMRSAIAKHLNGRTEAGALIVSEIAAALGNSPEGIRPTLEAMVEVGALAKTDRKTKGRTAAAYYDPQAALGLGEPLSETAKALVDEICGDASSDSAVAEIPQPSLAGQIEFALWDDGRLTISDGDEVTQLPPDATKRLALLLGVPGASLVSNLGV